MMEETTAVVPDDAEAKILVDMLNSMITMVDEVAQLPEDHPRRIGTAKVIENMRKEVSTEFPDVMELQLMIVEEAERRLNSASGDGKESEG